MKEGSLLDVFLVLFRCNSFLFLVTGKDESFCVRGQIMVGLIILDSMFLSGVEFVDSSLTYNTLCSSGLFILSL